LSRITWHQHSILTETEIVDFGIKCFNGNI